MPSNLRLYQGILPTTETVLYTNTTGNIVDINEVVVENNTAVAAVFSLSIVPVGGTAGNSNRVLNGDSVPANGNQTFEWQEVLNPGETISGSQVTANALTVTISGGGVPR